MERDPWGPHTRLALTDPVRAQSELRTALDSADSDRERAAIGQGLGVALRTLGNADDSRQVLEIAVDDARNAGDPELIAELELTLSGSRATSGDPEGAIRLAEHAREGLVGPAKARANVQLAAFAARSGSFDDAFALFTEAESELEAAGDLAWLARLYNNRALIRVYSGDVIGAEADLRRSLDIKLSAGLTAHAGEALHNLGWIKSRQGDLVEALRLYGEATEVLSSLDYPLNELLTDRAETLVAARLTAEALSQATEAVETIDAGAAPIDLPEAWLTYAEAASIAGQPTTARAAALEAQRGFTAVASAGWLSLANLMVAAGEIGTAEADAHSIDEALVDASSAGWKVRAYEIGLDAARLEAKAGNSSRAHELLTLCDSILDADRLPSTLRANRHGTAAAISASEGDEGAAAADASAALEILTEYRNTIAATDMRASTALLSVDAMHVLVDLLSGSESYEEIVREVDRGRASMVNPPPVNPPQDPDDAALITELRDQVSALAGLSESIEEAVDDLRASETTYQQAVDARREGDPLALDTPAIAIVSGSDAVHTVLIVDERATLLSRTPKNAVRDALDGLLASLPYAEERWGAVLEATSNLDDLLFSGQAPSLARAVLSPPSWMMSIPWTLLKSVPSSVVVAPRLSAFLDRAGPISPAKSLLAVVGPDLSSAATEVAAIAGHYRGATVLAEGEASVNRTLGELPSVDVAHIAAHGLFRADNPLFSSLGLSDGELHVHQIERLRTVPPTVVLASCDSAAVASTGADLTGFASTMLSAGVRSLIAAVTPVPDTAATNDLMRRLHAGLAHGTSPSDALAEARRAHESSDPLDTLSANTFQCFGWG